MARYPRGVPPIGQIIAVLAIIVFIAAVLFPVFQKVHEGHGNSRSQCASDLNQLGLALTQYTQDSDDKLPSGVNTAGNGWAGGLYPFTKSTGLSAPQDSKRHNDEFGLNFLAVDGHVRYLKPDQVSGGPNAVSAKTLPQDTYVETFAIK